MVDLGKHLYLWHNGPGQMPLLEWSHRGLRLLTVSPLKQDIWQVGPLQDCSKEWKVQTKNIQHSKISKRKKILVYLHLLNKRLSRKHILCFFFPGSWIANLWDQSILKIPTPLASQSFKCTFSKYALFSSLTGFSHISQYHFYDSMTVTFVFIVLIYENGKLQILGKRNNNKNPQPNKQHFKASLNSTLAREHPFNTLNIYRGVVKSFKFGYYFLFISPSLLNLIVYCRGNNIFCIHRQECILALHVFTFCLSPFPYSFISLSPPFFIVFFKSLCVCLCQLNILSFFYHPFFIESQVPDAANF